MCDQVPEPSAMGQKTHVMSFLLCGKSKLKKNKTEFFQKKSFAVNNSTAHSELYSL